MKSLFLAILLAGISSSSSDYNYSTGKGRITFFAEAPISNVDATNNSVSVWLSTASGALSFDMNMADFKFHNAKMGRDARDRYLETTQYPKAGFSGKIDEKVDYSKPGSYPITASGKMTIHGTTRDVREKGTVMVSKGQIRLQSQFYVRLQDYNISTPEILGQKMTAENVLVKIDANLVEMKKSMIGGQH